MFLIEKCTTWFFIESLTLTGYRLFFLLKLFFSHFIAKITAKTAGRDDKKRAQIKLKENIRAVGKTQNSWFMCSLQKVTFRDVLLLFELERELSHNLIVNLRLILTQTKILFVNGNNVSEADPTFSHSGGHFCFYHLEHFINRFGFKGKQNEGSGRFAVFITTIPDGSKPIRCTWQLKLRWIGKVFKCNWTV